MVTDLMIVLRLVVLMMVGHKGDYGDDDGGDIDDDGDCRGSDDYFLGRWRQ